MAAYAAIVSMVAQQAQARSQAESQKKQTAALQNQILAQQAAEKRNLLARQLASQRAKMSAGGFGDSGSADALMEGLQDQTTTSIMNAEANSALEQSIQGANNNSKAIDGIINGISIARKTWDIIKTEDKS